jgi:hypothetical protein
MEFMQFLFMTLKSWSGVQLMCKAVRPTCVCFIEKVVNSYCLTPFFRI